MPGYRRRSERIQGHREALSIAATLGREFREERRRRGLTAKDVADRLAISRSWVTEIERGGGAGTTLETWISLGLVVGRPLAISLSRSLTSTPADAGHLDLQEAVLRLAHDVGMGGVVELPTLPTDPTHSIDVCLRNDRHRALVIVECWNSPFDLGAALRSSDRKVAEARELAVVIGGDRPYAVHLCWVLRPNTANRELVQRYPDVLLSRFPGSSVGWVRALTEGSPPPLRPGLVWLDPTVGRPTPARLRRHPPA